MAKRRYYGEPTLKAFIQQLTEWRAEGHFRPDADGCHDIGMHTETYHAILQEALQHHTLYHEPRNDNQHTTIYGCRLRPGYALDDGYGRR